MGKQGAGEKKKSSVPKLTIPPFKPKKSHPEKKNLEKACLALCTDPSPLTSGSSGFFSWFNSSTFSNSDSVQEEDSVEKLTEDMVHMDVTPQKSSTSSSNNNLVPSDFPVADRDDEFMANYLAIAFGTYNNDMEVEEEVVDEQEEEQEEPEPEEPEEPSKKKVLRRNSM